MSPTGRVHLSEMCLPTTVNNDEEENIFERQVTRLRATGFSRLILATVAKTLQRNQTRAKAVSQMPTAECLQNQMQPEVTSYLRRVGVATIDAVCWLYFQCLESMLCSQIPPEATDKKSAKPFVRCAMKFTCQRPLKREYILPTKNKTGSRLLFHWGGCNWSS